MNHTSHTRAPAWHRRAARGVASLLCAMGVCVGWGAWAKAAPETITIFAEIEEAEARARTGRVQSEVLRDQLVAHSDAITQASEDLATRRRATRALQHELIRTHVRWERARRSVRRGGATWRPHDAADMRMLMRHAAPRVAQKRRKEHELVGELDTGAERVLEMVGRHGAMAVTLAQHRGEAEAAEAAKDEAMERASEADAEEVAADLAHTEEELAREIGLMLKNPTSRDFHRLKGTLLPPTSADPAYAYGPRKQRHSVSYVRHTGLTYNVEEGTEVRATARGLVVYAAFFEGFGLVVILDHGGAYHSLYAHLSEVGVEVGDQIERGHALGKSGESGSLDGPKLYFELRHDGRPIDPEPWFIRVKKSD